ncbi:MAG TPA: DoxX family protein [Gemmatimonadaceae bacterium]|nr:DoxX family protein [Gemmatimonadaceae bacterium]
MLTIDRRALWIATALCLARAVLGLIFFMAGVYKVFSLGPVGHVQRFFLPYQDTFLPTWSLWAVGLVIPFVELGAGALVLLGWLRTEAYWGLGLVLVVVTFGHLLREPLYPFHEHVIPRLALLLLLLLMPPQADRFSIDELHQRSQDKAAASLEKPLD